MLPKDTGTEFVVIDRGEKVRPVKPFAETAFEPPDTPSVYSGRPLSLEEMARAVDIEAGKRR